VAITLPLDKIQSIRLASVLLESEYDICFPASAEPVLEALSKYFAVSYRIGTQDAVPLKDVAIAHGPVPESRIGRISRPLLYPHAAVRRCRDKWRAERDVRFSFTGLVTPGRKRILEAWCQSQLGEKIAVRATRETYLQRLVSRISSGFAKPQKFPAVGLEIFTSNRGRVFPAKVWDDGYFDTLARSQFVLCPDGDFIWTYRFFEAILCGAIPIIEHTCSLYERFEYFTMQDDAEKLVRSPKTVERNFAEALRQLTVGSEELNRELTRLVDESHHRPT